MRSSTLLALTAAFGPLAVLSSPHPPPEVWEIEIITLSLDDAQLYRPPGRPATATTSSSGASITSGTEKDLSGDDECENEDSSSSTTSAVGANPLAGGAGNNSLPTTLSTVVADKIRRQDTIGSEPPNTIGDKLRRQNQETTPPPDAQVTINAEIAAVENLLPLGNIRRQIEDPSSSTTSAAVAGVYAPAGFGGTNYPTPTSSMSAGGVGGVKKLKNCAKGPVKLKGGDATSSGGSFTDVMPTATSTDAMPAATGTSSAAASSAAASSAATSSAAM